MQTFRVKHNFSASQPAWRGDYVRRYGEHNEGFTIQAESLEQAKKLLREQPFNLNPFYLTIKPE